MRRLLRGFTRVAAERCACESTILCKLTALTAYSRVSWRPSECCNAVCRFPKCEQTVDEIKDTLNKARMPGAPSSDVPVSP